MSFDFDRAAALEKMPRCGSCVNAKIIVWTGDVELKARQLATLSSRLGLEKHHK